MVERRIQNSTLNINKTQMRNKIQQPALKKTFYHVEALLTKISLINNNFCQQFTTDLHFLVIGLNRLIINMKCIKTT